MDYITRSIPSLLASRLPEEIEVVIYDDCSPNPALGAFLRQVAQHDSRVRIIRGTENKGPNLGQQDIYAQVVAEYPDAPYYVNVDDDVVYHRDWFVHLATARSDCRAVGLRGVFTALNMPYRAAHSSLVTGGRKYLLKWKQPALNWLIPRDVYEAVGPFRDEGIAYDTVYSHWMRLRHFPVICLSPSYVQNIGLVGAYATDDTTTSLDFVGEGGHASALRRWTHAARYKLRRFPDRVRRIFDAAAQQIAPVRWGTEFVHEGISGAGQSVAMFSFDDAERLGWTKEAAARRAVEVQQACPEGSAGILAVRKNRNGMPVWVECRWQFSPNLRELATLGLPQERPDAVTLFQSIVRQLLPLHQRRVAHNKIRQENIYLEGEEQTLRLTWLGTEPCPGINLQEQGEDRTIAMLSGALNRWARNAVRETFAARYLDSVAPEVIQGRPATPASDIFAAAAVTALQTVPPVQTLEALRHLRHRWATGHFAELRQLGDAKVRRVLEQCLSSDPAQRPADAMEVMRRLGS